jgi:hypothetical protein
LKSSDRGVQVKGRRLGPDVRHAGVQRVATISRCRRCFPSFHVLEEVRSTLAILRCLLGLLNRSDFNLNTTRRLTNQDAFDDALNVNAGNTNSTSLYARIRGKLYGFV